MSSSQCMHLVQWTRGRRLVLLGVSWGYGSSVWTTNNPGQNNPGDEGPIRALRIQLFSWTSAAHFWFFEYRSTLNEYSSELKRVLISLLRFMAKNLGVEPVKLTSMFEECTQGIRMNYYPPCVLADKVMGLTPHSDATGLTLLVQVNEVQGLQIKKNKKWLPIKPVPGAIIVNIGDILEIYHGNILSAAPMIMSNGEYSSIEHRAVINSEKERLSIAAFHNPNYGAKIGPLPDLVEEVEANYKTLDQVEYVRLVMSNKLDGKGLLDSMKIRPVGS